jgi:excisionase family DNA binding protein
MSTTKHITLHVVMSDGGNGTVTKPNEQRLTNVRGVSQMTGMKEVTVRKWIAERRIASVRMGRSVRISVEEVERFIRENTVPAVRQ